MKRTDFLAGIAAASAIPLVPKIARAEVSGTPSLKGYLPKNAVVKFEKFREWVDPTTQEPHATYKIRYTVVPDEFAPCSYEPNRAFLTKISPTDEVLPDGTPSEGEAWTFVFVTYGVHAVGRKDISTLRREISSGMLSPCLCLEGAVPAPYFPNTDPSRTFPAMVRWQAKYQNRHYALWKETGVHPDFNSVLRQVGGMTA